MNNLDGKENAMTAVQVAKKELRRKIQNLLKDVPRESVTAQCSDTFFDFGHHLQEI
jgi:5-formyltetrahydrofolate cyclo-ligase